MLVLCFIRIATHQSSKNVLNRIRVPVLIFVNINIIRLLQVLSAKYSWIEWGVLLRPDLEGTPRYASMDWVRELAEVNRENGSIMRCCFGGHWSCSVCFFTFTQVYTMFK